MEENLAGELRKLPQVDVVVPFRMVKVPYQDTQVCLMAIDAQTSARMEKQRLRASRNAGLIARLHAEPDSVIVSENFAALYRVRAGDVVTLPAEQGPVQLRVIGAMVDYTWNHGSLLVDRRDFKKHWHDDKVSAFDVYLKSGVDVRQAKELVDMRFGAQHQLFAATHDEMQAQIDSVIERLYGIGYAQQLVVIAVAALGVITALLISVMQRQREIGLLRAIGASRSQVIRSVLAEACLMGVIGAGIGILVAMPLQWYILQVVILDESGYLFPVHIPWIGAVVIGTAALLTATAAGLFPALHAVRQRIPEAIAYE
jgi:putative ABC transport system permease protein